MGRGGPSSARGTPGKSHGADPASYKALLRRTPPAGMGLSEVLWRVRASLGETGLGPFLGATAGGGGSSRHPPSGGAEQGRLRGDTKGICPGLEDGGTGRGEMESQGEAPSVGLEWGVLTARRAWGWRGRCQPARFLLLPGTALPRDPYPGREQNWFLDWQRQGARDRKPPGGQEGSGRPETEVTEPGQGTLALARTRPRHLCWGFL